MVFSWIAGWRWRIGGSGFLAALLITVAHAGDGTGLDWPQWRGPLANGFSPTAQPPTRWSETQNVRWKIPIPGKGHASPILFGDAVIVLTAVPVGDPQPPVYDQAPGVHDSVPVTHRHEYGVLAMSRKDGHVLWRTVVREEWPHEGGHSTGSPASNSPVTDGQSLFALFGSRGLYCLGPDGAVRWRRDLGRMSTLHAHGEGSSPVVHGDLLVVNWDHEKGSCIEAFDTRTGATRWKTPRDEKTSWSTPLVWRSTASLRWWSAPPDASAGTTWRPATCSGNARGSPTTSWPHPSSTAGS